MWWVWRPRSSRSVSATCTFGASAGWQQVNIRRSRSSPSGPTASSSLGSSRACSSAACAWRSLRDASRRSRSIARLRAVVMIHPAGRGGSPSAGQCSSAAMKASCTASCAMSMSAKTRTSTATARPYSSAKTRSISADCTSVIAEASVLAVVLERPHFDGQRDDTGGPASALQRRVEIGGADDREPAEVLLALDIRAVGDQRLVPFLLHDRGRAGVVQAPGEHPHAGLLHLFAQGMDLAHDALQIDRRRRHAVGLVDTDQVLSHRGSWMAPPAPCRRLTPKTKAAGPDRHPGWAVSGLFAAAV